MKSITRIAQYVAVVAVAVALIGCGVPKGQHKMLEEKYVKVQKEMEEFNAQVKSIQLENVTLKKEVERLKGQISSLSNENKTVKDAYQKLLKEKESLEAKSI